MPLPIETECIVRDGDIFSGTTTDPDKFWIYSWEGHSQPGRGNWKIAVPLTVVSSTPGMILANVSEDLKRRKRLPRITLGKPLPPEPPVIMGGGVPVLGLTASSKVDPETKKRSDEYKLLRSQPLPSQERHEYKSYPEDVRPGQNLRHKRSHSPGIMGRASGEQPVYHSYLALSWQYMGLQAHVLDCLNHLESVCVAHYLPAEMLAQSLAPGTDKPQKKPRNMRFGSSLRHRMEAFISQGRIAFLMGNVRAVAMQLELITGQGLGESEVHELEKFQAFEELAALDRGLPVLYLYPFHNIYEMERAGELHSGPNVHNRDITYVAPLRELRCLLQPGPLQRQLECHAHPSLYL